MSIVRISTNMVMKMFVFSAYLVVVTVVCSMI